MTIVDDDLPAAFSPCTAFLKATLEDIVVDVLDHHLTWHLVLVNNHLELLLTSVNSLIQLLILRHLLGDHLDLVNLRHHEPILLLRLLLLLLLILHDLDQLLLSQIRWLNLVLLGKILLLYRCATSWLLYDHVLLLFGLLLLNNPQIITGYLL